MFTKAFWKATTERAISTAAQSVLLVVGADQLFNALEADWGLVAGFAAGGAVLSILKALAAAGVKGDGPSFTDAETLTEPTSTFTKPKASGPVEVQNVGSGGGIRTLSSDGTYEPVEPVEDGGDSTDGGYTSGHK